ncbi:MAG: hypothetical protein AB8B49_04555 [Nitratireductor sp.]
MDAMQWKRELTDEDSFAKALPRAVHVNARFAHLIIRLISLLGLMVDFIPDKT